MRKYQSILLILIIYIPAFSQMKTDTLSEVIVSGKYYRKYNTNTVSSALRIKTPLLQPSQNIKTVNADIILDQNAFNTTDGVTRNVSGIVRQNVSNNLEPCGRVYDTLEEKPSPFGKAGDDKRNYYQHYRQKTETA